MLYFGTRFEIHYTNNTVMKKLFILAGILTVFLTGCEVRPYADFLADKKYVQPHETIYFTNLSDKAKSYQWDFGDGTISNVPNPTHAYTSEGYFDVTLTATSKDGHQDVAAITIEVFADFLIDKPYAQPNEIISFTNFSHNAISYHWNFGDGTSTNISNPTHIYTSEGYFNVTLTATYSNGHENIITKIVEIFYTELEITVAEWNEAEVIDYIVPGAFVLLYETLDDWYYDEYAVVYGTADKYGIISFIGLESRTYYVWAEADNIAEPGDHYDNYQFYEENLIDYISTPVLNYATINPWIAWVEYYYPTLKSAKKRKSKYDLDKIKRKDGSFIKPDVSN